VFVTAIDLAAWGIRYKNGGTHRVELRSMPRSFVRGSIVSGLGLVLHAAGLVVMSCGSSQGCYRTTT